MLSLAVHGNCSKSYIGDMGHSFGTRLDEHQKEVNKLERKHYTRAIHKESTAEKHKSAITVHVADTKLTSIGTMLKL